MNNFDETADRREGERIDALPVPHRCECDLVSHIDNPHERQGCRAYTYRQYRRFYDRGERYLYLCDGCTLMLVDSLVKDDYQAYRDNQMSASHEAGSETNG